MPAATIVGIRTAYSGWTKLSIATIRFADGPTFSHEIEDHGSAAAVLPYDPERRRAILVRQLRAPVLVAANQEELLEAIAGIIEAEEPAACARREAREEAGLALDSLEHVGTAWTMPGLSTERMHFYLARYHHRPGGALTGGIAADHERTSVAEIGLCELAAMADDNRLADVKTLFLVQTLRLRCPALFPQAKAR